MVENNIGIHLVAPSRLRVGGASRPPKVTSGTHVMRLEQASTPLPQSSAKSRKSRRSISSVRAHRQDGKRRANSALRAHAARRPIQHSWIGRLVGDRGDQNNTGVGNLCTRKVVICFPTEERSPSKVGSLKDRTTNQHN